AGAVSRCGAGVPAWTRAADRGAPRSARRVGGVALRQPLGRRGARSGRSGAAQPPRNRDRCAHLPRLSQSPRLITLACAGRRRRTDTTPALGEYGHQGPGRVGHALRRSARGTGYDRHDSRENAARALRPRPTARRVGGGRRRRRGDTGGVPQGRGRRRRAGDPAPARRCAIIRQILERPHGLHRNKEPSAPERRGGEVTTTMESTVLPSMRAPTECPAWQGLAKHAESIRGRHLRTLFADEPARGDRMTLEAAGLVLDYSKNRVTDETLDLLVRLASECGLRERITAMFAGEKINVTEKRAVLHVALRAP